MGAAMTDAAILTRDLGGRWHGRYGTAPCPVCQPERRRDQNALGLADGRDGRLLANCKKSACAFADILAAAGLRSGDYSPPDPETVAQREREAKAEAEKRAKQAERCWTESMPIGGTIAVTYLRNRGITCDLPSTLRFHGACWHGPTARRHPALVALIQGADGFAVLQARLRRGSRRSSNCPKARFALASAPTHSCGQDRKPCASWKATKAPPANFA